MTHIAKGSATYRRTLLAMLLGSIVTFAVLYSPQTLLGQFSEEFGVSPSSASLVISVSTISLAVCMMFISAFSNAWGRKNIMVASLFATSALAILSSFVHSFQLLLALRLLLGISLSGFPAVAMTYLNEEIAPDSIGKAMGVYVGGTAIGGFVGRVIVSLLTDAFDWHAGLLTLGAFSLICSALFWLYLPQSRRFRPSGISLRIWAGGLKAGLADKRLLPLYAAGFLLLGGYVTLFNYIGYLLAKPPYGLSQSVIGCLFVFQLVGSWSSFFFGRMADRYSRAGLIAAGVVLSLLGAGLTLAGSLTLTIAGIVLFAFGFFAGHTVASGWVGKTAAPPYKAYASSLYLLFYYLGSSVLGTAGGSFLSAYGWPGVVGMIGVLLVLVAILAAALAGRRSSALRHAPAGRRQPR
ncbi:MFS transporter [Paenibacillus sp. MWE-103]|uniref:MFS transporter n=1 Tax=Paenibacillus artemisiicola TaxID=1172618 RepID=A0ABS3WES8_9BACL|nr:MFS transporter [Paenibacillus artemisiicola]MBO7746814.1 MFS transporter [Paenibacillus artemisiicola]